MNTGVLWSRDGVNFSTLHVWTNPPNPPRVLVPLAANETTYFYSFIDRGTSQRYSEIKAARVSPDQGWGPNSCGNRSSQGSVQIVPVVPSSVGKPVNVTNGNMYLTETDYSLPGKGESISISRNYNSLNQSSGLFGHGWSFEYDQSISLVDARTIRLGMNDGRGIYFANLTSGTQFKGITPGFPGTFDANTDGTYTLTFNDGTSRKFGTNGKLLWLKDRNGNQTTVNYNGSGILTGVTDAFGRTLTITVGANGLISQISDALGVVAVYDYFDSTSLLKTVTYPDGSMYKFEYDQTSVPNKKFLKTVKDALDNILETHEYDPQGRATTSEVHGGNEKYELNYSNWTASSPYTLVKHRKSLTDPFIETKFHFAPSGIRSVVNKVEGLCGCGGSGSETTQYFYDSELNLVKIIDAELNETTYAYDSSRNLTSMTDVLGTQSFTYNSFGQMLTATDRMSGVTTNTYNTAGDLLTTTDALGNVTTYTYPTTNNKGLPETIKDARNNITKFKWFPTSGLLQEIEDPYAKKTNFTYDTRGRIDTITNAKGFVTDYNYFDDTQRKVEMIYPNLDKVTYKFDIRRLLESVTDERGKITNYEFDPQYRLKKITDPLGNAKELGYDDMSNLISYNDQLATPSNNITNYIYDDFNRLKEIEYPASTSGAARLKEKFDYDKIGRIKKVTDTANRDTIYSYDDVNRKVSITNAELEVTELTFNKRLQMTTVEDAKDQVYTFAYDPLGRVLSQTRAGGTMSFDYDEVGNQTKRTDYNGRVTNYEYDQLNRLKKIKYGDAVTPGTPVPEATYGYDEISRLISAVNDSGTVSFGYDSRNRMTTTTDVFSQTVSYEYERTSTTNQKRLKLNGALYATYNYDNAERLLNIVNASDSTTIGFTYFEDGAVKKRTYPNGVTTDYLYDNMRRLTRLTDTGPSGDLFDRQYAYNNANQISQITELGGIRMFGYDDVDRLTSVSGSATENYVFDQVGNRTSSHLASNYGYQVGQYNRLTSAVTPSQTVVYGFDANGNTTQKAEGKEFWRYKWDLDNRLVEASTRKEKVQYKYDALGRRVSRIQGNGKDRTKFTYDGDDVLVDDADGSLTKYLNGDGIDDKLRATTGISTSYFLSDHLGSTNGLLNTSGSLTSSNSYDSFGNPTNSSFPTRYQFTGREYDSFSGLQYSRARFYDPKIGRFISEDPIGFAGGDVNLYGYVKNKPINRTDPLGLDDADREFRETDEYKRLAAKGDKFWRDRRGSRPSFKYDFGCSESGLSLGAFFDFANNYRDMRAANTVGADKFFHCMANCQAGGRGSLGRGIAVALSEGREAFDQYAKGDPASACEADRFANNTGLVGGSACRPCVQVCAQFRPNGLTYPVPFPQTDPCQGFGNWSCK